MNNAYAMQNRVRFAYGLALVLLLSIGVLAWWNARRYRETLAWINHTNQVIDALDEILGATLDAETGQRGFIISGNDRHLIPHDSGVRRAGEAMTKLEALVQDNPVQLERAAVLRDLVEQRLDHTSESIELRRVNAAAAMERVSSSPGLELMEQVREQIDEMRGVEAGLLQKRTSANLAISGRAGVAVLTGGAIAVLVIFASGIVLLRDVRRRLQSEEALRQSEESLSIMLHSIGDGVLATDGLGIVTQMNPIAEQLTGWTLAEAKGRPIGDVFNIIKACFSLCAFI